MPAKPKLDKAAKKEARREKRAASKARRRQIWEAFKIQRREDKALVPLMVGAFLVCVLLVVRHRADLRRALARAADRDRDRRAGGGEHLRPAGAAVGLLQGRGPAGRRGLGAGATARPVAGHPGRRGHHAPRRRAPRDRPARRHPGRRGRPAPRQGPAGAGEEAPRPGGGQDPDLRHRRRQRRGPGPAGQAAAPPHEAAAQHLHGQEMDTLEARLAALGSRAAALPKGPLPAGAKMRSVQRTVRRR